MNEPALVIIKPDGMSKGLVGGVLSKFAETSLRLVAMRTAQASRALAKEHYAHLRDKPFFNQIVSYLAGEYHQLKQLIAIVYYGRNAIRQCRQVAGVTNPEAAGPHTIRGAYGRITTDGLFENVVHVSSTPQEACREIKLWFSPEDIMVPLYPTRNIMVGGHKRKIWA